MPWSLFIFRGHSKRELAFNRVTYFILLAYTGTGLATGHTGKTRSGEVSGKNAGEWTGKVEISK